MGASDFGKTIEFLAMNPHVVVQRCNVNNGCILKHFDKLIILHNYKTLGQLYAELRVDTKHI